LGAGDPGVEEDFGQAVGDLLGYGCAFAERYADFFGCVFPVADEGREGGGVVGGGDGELAL
jgi:hypothetical protein